MSDREDALRLAMEADPFEKIIDRYVDDYTLEGDDGTHTPTHEEKILIKDAIIGLLVDPDWDTEWGKHIDQLCRDKFVEKGEELDFVWVWSNKTSMALFNTEEAANSLNDGGASTYVKPIRMPVFRITGPTATSGPAPTEGATPILPDLESEAYYFPPSAEPFFDADQMRKCAKNFARLLELQRNELRERVKEFEKDAARHRKMMDALTCSPLGDEDEDNPDHTVWRLEVLLENNADSFSVGLDAAIAKEGTKP